MKDNLVQKLDLLEAQLARIEARKGDVAKLNRTKHLLEKLEKSGNVLPGRQELYEQIADVKREIVNRKKFHAETLVKRAVKQFIKVEPLRIAKRKKNQEDNKEKLAVLDAELALVQSLDVESWSHNIVERFMQKQFNTDYEKRALTPAETNVLARIRKTDPVKKALAQLDESATLYLERVESNTEKKIENNNSNSKKTTIELKNENANNHHNSDPSSSNEVLDETPAAKSTKDDDFTQFDSEIEDDEEEEQQPEMDPFFQQQVGLPELYQGYISGSEDESEIEEVEKPARKNRRGQRARRKIWEQKFGHRANHVIKQENQERELQEQKEQKKRKRDEKQEAIKRQKREFAAKPVHPSWAAHQKMKEQQKAATFQGKKIQFD